VLFKLLTAVFVALLAAESLYILMHRHPTKRFKSVEGYSGVVAFDTGTGQLCKTLRTRSVAEIKQSEADAATVPEPCPPLPAPSGDPVLDEINRVAISKRCGGNGEDVAQQSGADSWEEFAANLPACADIP
jgi:hypothetical protein